MTQMLVVASARELPQPEDTWGHGGWLPPEQREALDWLTFARLSGWSVTARTPAGPLDDAARWIVVACDPEELGEEHVLALRRRAEDGVLVVARAAPADRPLAVLAGCARAASTHAGREVAWQGPGPKRSWSCRATLETALQPTEPDCRTWASLGGAPLVSVRSVGAGAVATLGFHPSRGRDVDGAATALLRSLLVHGAREPVARLDFEGTLVLRMDDPGGAQNVHWSEWRYTKLGETQWREIAAELRKRDARLSVAYTPGWVDDGDARRGRLLVDGRPGPRRAGAVWDSPRVRYESATAASDYASEFRGISTLRAAGLGDVELHGHTHLHPDVEAWADAPDRYDTQTWYREFGLPTAQAIAARSAGEHPLELGLAALGRTFGVQPTTFVPPGDQFHDADVREAHRLGFSLVESYYLALRDGDRFCWSQHVCAPYLDLAAPDWLAAGLPVVGYFHDNDLVPEGVGWLGRRLDEWSDAGVKRFIDFRELAAALAREVDVRGADEPFLVAHDDAPPRVRPVPVVVSSSGRETTHAL